MPARFWWLVLALPVAFFLVGCKGGSTSSPKAPTAAAKGAEGDVQANLAKLSPEDRKLAEEQGFCAIEMNPLGSMGVPVKVVIKDQPVFLCCEACQTKAVAHADRTLAKVKELKEKKSKTTAP